MKNVSARLASGPPLILDGAMGTQLLAKGVDVSLPLWSAAALESSPETVREVHSDYASAGADILTTNTFRTTSRTFQKVCKNRAEAERRARRASRTAVEIARDAAGEDRYVAGSIAPLEDCYLPDLFPGVEVAAKEFRQLGEWFVEDGVDCLLIETMGRIDEALCALRATAGHSLPRWLSFIVKDGEHLLDGTPLAEAAAAAVDEGISALLINCSSVPEAVKAVESVRAVAEVPLGLYPNLGKSMPSPDGTIEQFYSLKEFSQAMREGLSLGARIVGSCCGSGPEHTATLRELVQQREDSSI